MFSAEQNCYENELINFIQVLIKAGDAKSHNVNQLFNFNLDENKGQLIKITASMAAEPGNPVVSIGKFAGREEAVYELETTGTAYLSL